MKEQEPPRRSRDELVAEIEGEMSGRRKRPTTIAYFIHAWDSFTRQVAYGYECGLYDYANGLTVRDRLARITSRSDEISHLIFDGLMESDPRFRNATTRREEPVMHLDGITPEDWWWHRWPTDPGAELAEELRLEHRACK